MYDYCIFSYHYNAFYSELYASYFELILYYSKLPVFYFFIQRLLANSASDVSSVRFCDFNFNLRRHLACTHIHSNKLRSLKCPLLRSLCIHLFNCIPCFISLSSLTKDDQKLAPDVVLILALSSSGVVKCKISRKALNFRQLLIALFVCNNPHEHAILSTVKSAERAQTLTGHPKSNEPFS